MLFAYVLVSYCLYLTACFISFFLLVFPTDLADLADFANLGDLVLPPVHGNLGIESC